MRIAVTGAVAVRRVAQMAAAGIPAPLNATRHAALKPYCAGTAR